MTTGCPAPDDLERSLLGRLPTLRQAELERHVSACRACEGRLRDLRHAGGPYDFLAPPCQPDEIGRLGTYRVLALLGQGGMGLVFRGEDALLGRAVALKVIRPEQANPAMRERFLREARAMAALDHDNIVRVWEVGQAGEVLYLAMPLLRGETLEERLRGVGTLSEADTAAIGRQIAEGLAAAHRRGIVHRDVKPANVWLEDGGRVLLLDFGLARMDDQRQLTDSGTILGTPAYIAPEQARGESGGPAADLFSLGCLLYRAATGRPAFEGETPLALLHAVTTRPPPSPRKANPRLSRPLAAVIGRLLAARPEDRFASARAAADALAGAVGRPARLPWRTPAVALVALVVLACVWWMSRSPAVVSLPPEPPRRTEVLPAPEVEERGWLDRLRPEDIAADERAALEDGAALPPELVAVLGSSRLSSWTSLSRCRFSDDDARLVCRTSAGVVIYDARTGARLRDRSAWGLTAAEWSDGRLALVVNHGKTLLVEGLDTGKLLRRFPDDATGWTWVALHKHRLLAGRKDGSACRWDLGREGGEPGVFMVKMTDKGDFFRQPTLSPDGERLVVRRRDGVVRCYDAATGAPLFEVDSGSRHDEAFAFLPDGRLVTPIQGHLRVLSAAGQPEQTWPIDLKAAVLIGLAISPGGDRFVAAFSDYGKRGTLLGDARTGTADAKLALGDEAAGHYLNFSNAGDRMVTSNSNRPRVFDARGGQEITPGAAAPGWVGGVALGADGATLHVATADGFWTAYDLTASPPRLLRRVRAAQRSNLWLAMTGDEALLVTGAPHERPRLWEPATGKPLCQVPANGYRFALARDARLLAVAVGGQATLYDLSDPVAPAEVRRFRWPRGFLACLAVSPRGDRVAVGTINPDEELYLWDATTGEARMSGPHTEPHDGRVRAANALAFAPSGEVLTAISHASVVRWDTASGRPATPARLDVPGGALGIVFSPDGRLAYTMDRGGKVVEHDLKTGRATVRFRAPVPAVTARVELLVSRDGRHLIAGHANGTVHVYRLAGPPR